MNTYVDICQGIVVVLAFCGTAWVGERVAQLMDWWKHRKGVR